MVLNDRSRNQIREEDQHGFKGIVQGLEYRLPTSAERLSHGIMLEGEYLHYSG